MLSVTHFYREPRNTGVSIEGIFKTVKNELKGKAVIVDFICDPNVSRLQNTFSAHSQATEVNHITGDVNFLALGLTGKKTILTIHDFGYYENPVHGKLKKLFYKLFWFQLPLKTVDIVTVVSNFTKSKLIEYFNFPEEKIRVIHDPVKPIFTFTPKETLNTVPVVLMLGTGKHKNLDNLIQAARGQRIHLDIIGNPAMDELEKLEDYAISHTVSNNLTDEEVFAHYKACDIVFMASLYEGFGMPIIEAQAVGRPVITSNIGAMKEIGEGTTLLIDPHNADDIRDAIDLLTDKEVYDAVVAKGVENAAKYDHKIIAEQYLAVYKELAESS